MTSSSGQIAKLNDAIRAAGPFSGGWMLTDGILAQGPAFITRAIARVCAFNAFTPDNDPHGEHDFGAFSLEGQRLFWKIDYYDRALESGSSDPADAECTRRILTLMLAEEY